MRKTVSPNHTSFTSEPASSNYPMAPARNQDPFFKTSQISTPMIQPQERTDRNSNKKNLNKDLSEELRIPVSSVNPSSLKIRKDIETPHFPLSPYEDSERANLELLRSPKLHIHDGLVLTNTIRKDIMRREKLLIKSYQDLVKKNVLQSKRSFHPSADSEEQYEDTSPLPSKLPGQFPPPLRVSLATNPQKQVPQLPNFLEVSDDALIASHKSSIKEEIVKEQHSVELPSGQQPQSSLYSNYPFKPFPGSTIYKRRHSQNPKGHKRSQLNLNRSREAPSDHLLSVSMSPKEASSHAPPTPYEPAPPSLKKSRKILKELSGYLDNCLDTLVPKLRGQLRYSPQPNSSSLLSSQPLVPQSYDPMNRTFMSSRALDKNKEASQQFRHILEPALNLHSLSPVRPRTQGGASKYIPRRHNPEKKQSTTHHSSKTEFTQERPKSQDKLQVSAVGSIIERSPTHDSKLLSRKVSFAEPTTLLQSRPIKVRNPKANDSSLQIDLEKKDVVIPTAQDSSFLPGATMRTTPLFISDSEDEAPTYRHILTSHSTTPHDLQGQIINLEKLRHRSLHPLVKLPQPRKLTKEGKQGLRQIFQHLPRQLPSFEPKKLPKACIKIHKRMPLYPALLNATHSTSLPLLLPKSQKTEKKDVSTRQNQKRDIIVVQDGQELEKRNALKLDLRLFQGKYTWIENESDVPGSKKQVSEAIEKQRQFQELELNQFLEYCSYHLGKNNKEFNFLSLVDGTPLQRLQDIPQDCRCLVVSEHQHFIGLPYETGFSRMFEQKKSPVHKQRTKAHLQEITSKWISAQQRDWRSHSSPYLDNTNSLNHLRSTNSPTPLGDKKLKVVLSKDQGFFKLSRDPDQLPPLTPLGQDSSRRVLDNYHELLSKCSSNVTKTVKTRFSEKRGLVVLKLKPNKQGIGTAKLSSGRELSGRSGEQTKRTSGGRGEDGFEKSNLEYDEVRALAHRYHLPNKFIYQIFSEFIAMREMIIKEKRLSRRDLELPKPLGDQGKKVWRLAIPLAFLKTSSPFFVSKHPELVRRILAAMGEIWDYNRRGLEERRRHSYTHRCGDLFPLKGTLGVLHMPCSGILGILAQGEDALKIKVIDSYGRKVLSEDEFLQVFEYIAEGSVGSQSNLLFSTYAGQVKSALEKADCLDEEGCLHMDLMEQAFNEGRLVHSVFTNTLKYDCDYRMKGAQSSVQDG